MSTHVPNVTFHERVDGALRDEILHTALDRATGRFTNLRRTALASLVQESAVRDRARLIRAHTLSRLDAYLEQFEDNVERAGANGRVFGFPGRLVKIVFRCAVIALLIYGITSVIPDDGVVLLFLICLPVSLFRFAVMGVLILPVALPLELTDRLGVGGIAGKKQY